MTMLGKSFIYNSRTGCSTIRKILQEKTEDGLRIYILRDLVNPKSKEITAVADTLDQFFKTGTASILPKGHLFNTRKRRGSK